MKAVEINFDGLVGATHHYAGLAFGDLASEANAGRVSNPKKAALQSLKKMKILMDLGVPQAVLPPHERPATWILNNLGIKEVNSNTLSKLYRDSPDIFKAIYSASGMWVANAATVTPSSDSQDGRVHITPANLMTYFHRAIETDFNHQLLNKIFSNQQYFQVHSPLFSQDSFADEGAANHHRVCLQHQDPGFHLFVYGRDQYSKKTSLPHRNPARQTLLASESIARLHGLRKENILFVKESVKAIDKGVFHSDVIATANQNVFLYHESAFDDIKQVVKTLREKVAYPLYLIPISAKELSFEEAVQSYFFNSQIVTLRSGEMVIIAPLECQNKKMEEILFRIIEEENPIRSLQFVDCSQSMLNGGGPACLRLRVVLTLEELDACHTSVFLDQGLYQRLVDWVEKYYRDKLVIADLLDPDFLQENYRSLDELTKILQLGTLYNFQKI